MAHERKPARTMTSDAQLLTGIGELLYGRGWQRRVASSTGYSQQLMSRIVGGVARISPQFRRALYDMLGRESDALRARQMLLAEAQHIVSEPESTDSNLRGWLTLVQRMTDSGGGGTT